MTLVLICCGCEFAADVVNSNCCTISTENFVEISEPLLCSLFGGSNESGPLSVSSAGLFKNFCC